MQGLLDLARNPSVGQAASAVAQGDWSAATSALGRSAVKSVTIRTQVSPAFTFDPFAESPPNAPTNPLLSLLKPEVTIETPTGTMTMAPYGMPTASYFPWLVAGLVVFGVGLVVGIGYVARRMR